MKTCGIYTIRNIVTGAIYVGASVNVESRLRVHKHELNHDKHSNDFLQSSFKKHGENSFEFKLAFECDKSELEFFEYAYMDELLKDNVLYNVILSDQELKTKSMAYYSWNEEGVKLRIDGIKAAWQNDETRAKWIKSLVESAGTKANRQRVSKQAKAQWQNPEFKAKVVAKLKDNAENNPEFKAKVSKASKANWERDEYRESLSKSRKDMWANDEFKTMRKKQMAETRKTPEYQKSLRAGKLAYWSSPEGLARKARMSAKCKGNSGNFKNEAISSQA